MARIAQKDDDVMEAGAAPKSGASSVPDGSAPEQIEMQLSSDFRTAFEGGLFLLAFLAALYATREIVLPVVLAFVLRLLLQPAVRMLERLRVPAVLGALLLIALLLGAVVTFGTALYGPAASWAAKLPEGIPRLQEHLSFLRAPIEAIRNFVRLTEGYVVGQAQPAGPGAAQAATDGDVWITFFAGSRAFVAGLLEMVLVLFFLLIAGDTFLRRLVEILPRFSDKRQALEMSQHIEQDISAYLLTVTIMNVGVDSRRQS